MDNTHKEVFLKFNLRGAAFIPIELKDGSVYYMDKVYELKALDMKLQSEGISLEDFKYIIAIETEKHWNGQLPRPKSEMISGRGLDSDI